MRWLEYELLKGEQLIMEYVKREGRVRRSHAKAIPLGSSVDYTYYVSIISIDHLQNRVVILVY